MFSCFSELHINLLEKPHYGGLMRRRGTCTEEIQKDWGRYSPSSRTDTTIPLPDNPRAQTGRTLISIPRGPEDWPMFCLGLKTSYNSLSICLRICLLHYNGVPFFSYFIARGRTTDFQLPTSYSVLCYLVSDNPNPSPNHIVEDNYLH